MSEPTQRGQLWDRRAEGLGFYGRWYITETLDGHTRQRRVCRALKENGKPIVDPVRAQWKLDQLIAENTGSKEAAERGETFGEAARRVAHGNKERFSRLRRFVFPHIEHADPATIKKSTVLDVLKSIRDLKKAKNTMRNALGDISVVLQDLVDAEVLTRNVARLIDMKKDFPEALPEVTKRSKKIRAVLTDDELGEYVTWEHPDENHRKAVHERQAMSAVARTLGGLRTSDLHAIRYENFGAPDFLVAFVERQKRSGREDGGTIQEYEIPAMLRPILKQWWEENGKPLTGLIFPKLRGADAGKGERLHSSHARGLRRDLRRMWGIDQRVLVEHERSNGRQLNLHVWKPDARPMTPRETMLLTEEHVRYRPVDFHSWRRAAAQAMKRGNVNAQQAMAALDHKNAGTHEKYLRQVEAVVIPAASLPPSLPTRVGHTAMGTRREKKQKRTDAGTPTEGERPTKGRDFAGSKTVLGFYTPAVAGSTPVPPTRLRLSEASP